MEARVGVAGLGLMGSGIASRLMDESKLVGVYNRTIRKTRPFAKCAFVANTPASLADKCDFIVTCVTDFDALRTILFEKRKGIAESNNKDLIIIDCSTILPSQSAYCSKGLQTRGIDMLGCPVMGGPSAAASGQLIPIVAGKKPVFKRAVETLKALGKPIFYAGPRDGQANAIKLALNLNIALIAGALSEAITLMKGYGADPGLFLKVLNSTYFKTGMSERKGPKMVAGHFAPSFHLRNMLKDIELATTLAQSSGLTIPLTSQAAQLFRAANNSGFSEMDYTAICAFVQKMNGLGKWKQK